jgi:hypothetical protein
MLHEIIPFLRASESTNGGALTSVWVHYPKGLPQRLGAISEQCLDHFPEEPRYLAHPCIGGTNEVAENKENKDVAAKSGHSLFQEVFFFCAVKNVGDVPGTGCIYVETVVDRYTGIAFARVYSARNAINAVDILASRVVPYFERQGDVIHDIHTRKTSEYCGLPLTHPFEAFLASSHIKHLPMEQPSQPCNYLCEQFYRFLLKEFFPTALRRKFHLSLDDVQIDLDALVNDYNSRRMKHDGKTGVGFFFEDNRNGQT